MKNIVYKVGFSVLILAAVLGITGGVALAASPGDSIVDKVNAIWGLLTSSKGTEATYNKLVTMEGQIADLHSDLAAVKTKVDNVTANMIRMETDEHLFIIDTTGYHGLVDVTYPELRRVNLTVSWGALSTGESLQVSCQVGGSGTSLFSIYDPPAADAYGNVSFDITTDRLIISATATALSPDYYVYYNVSSTYVPAP